MKGIILAGGSGTRLAPLTRVTNKHLLPVYDRPMIFFALESLASAGIDDVMLVTGREHVDQFRSVLGDARELGVRALRYAAQERPGGIAQALGLASDFAEGGPVAVLLGDNLFEDPLRVFADRYRAVNEGALLVLAEVPDPTAFGVAVLEDDHVVRVVEKPVDPPSPYVVTGLYFFDRDVFDIIGEQRPSARGELEITDVVNHYVVARRARHVLARGYWIDCGESVDALLRAATLVATRGVNGRPALSSSRR